MPTYELKCTECGTRDDYFFKSIKKVDGREMMCPICQKVTIHKQVMSTVNHIYKGSGFYQTDYKKK